MVMGDPRCEKRPPHPESVILPSHPSEGKKSSWQRRPRRTRRGTALVTGTSRTSGAPSRLRSRRAAPPRGRRAHLARGRRKGRPGDPRRGQEGRGLHGRHRGSENGERDGRRHRQALRPPGHPRAERFGAQRDPLHRHELRWWKALTSVTLDGSFHCVKACLPHMVKAGGGAIVTLGGMTALSGAKRRVHGSVGKFGLYGFTRALAKELGEHQVRVNYVAPGSRHRACVGPLGAARRVQRAPRAPRRAGGNRRRVRCLCGPGSKMISGQLIYVDGGHRCSDRKQEDDPAPAPAGHSFPWRLRPAGRRGVPRDRWSWWCPSRRAARPTSWHVPSHRARRALPPAGAGSVRPGASGTIGTAFVANSLPDGHAMMIVRSTSCPIRASSRNYPTTSPAT